MIEEMSETNNRLVNLTN